MRARGANPIGRSQGGGSPETPVSGGLGSNECGMLRACQTMRIDSYSIYIYIAAYRSYYLPHWACYMACYIACSWRGGEEKF